MKQNRELKELKWYEESGHVITLDKEKDQLHEDIYQFLERLDWEVDEADFTYGCFDVKQENK